MSDFAWGYRLSLAVFGVWIYDCWNMPGYAHGSAMEALAMEANPT